MPRLPGGTTAQIRRKRKRPRQDGLTHEEWHALNERNHRILQEKMAKKKEFQEQIKTQGPSKKEQKRRKRREELVERGKVVQTDYSLKELLSIKTKHCKDAGIVMALENVQDEVELRDKFFYQGTAGGGEKYFLASRYFFRFLLAKDGTPVCHICERAEAKVRR
eukprot:CAMPEP_0171059690 /NCGR_PEP_ID=MMETSP0766_2-20121228/3352_1 /TAXON_ID=439317 /ORGANISM="Gambierdiscus australes, Strain CAWD 149" /LENGTH=163 /DNA_ID=CAMNT_0011515169 /DNA_START=51 /DNA_END=542 /DNA_ORIENTATION=+